MYEYHGDKRLFVTADRERVVDEGDPEAAFLLVAPGGSLPIEDAKRYGLIKPEAEPEPKPEPEPETKAVQPDKDKAVRSERNK